MRPSFITAMRSLITSASSWSWVTKIDVMPRSRSRRRSSICMVSRSLRSSALNGSSSSSSAGFTAIERATAMRCCWPPERLVTPRSAKSSIRTSDSASCTRAATSAFGDPPRLQPEARRSRRPSDAETARSSGTPRRCCACARRRGSGRGPRPRCCRRRARSRPAMMRSSVVLPQPEGPSSETNSPRLTAMLSSLRTVALPKRFDTRATSTCPGARRGRVRPRRARPPRSSRGDFLLEALDPDRAVVGEILPVEHDEVGEFQAVRPARSWRWSAWNRRSWRSAPGCRAPASR